MGVIRNPIRASTHGFIVNPFGDEAMSLFGIEVKGRTLVNLLGVNGNFEVDSNADGVADGWTNNIAAPAVGALSTTNVKYGTKAQKITSTATEATAWRYTRRPISYVAGNYYLVLVDAITDGTSLATLRAYYNDVSGTLYASSTTSKTLYCKLLVTSNTTGSFIDLVNNNSIGTVGWVQFDGLRLYEITQATYNLIDVDPAYTGEQLAAKFPYVNSVQFKRDVMVRTLTSDGLTEISAAHIPQKIAQDESVWVFGNRAVYKKVWEKDVVL